MHGSIMRYPGGKAKLSKIIIEKLKNISSTKNLKYVEPFFGAGSVGLSFINEYQIKKAWINDKDKALCNLWKSVKENPDQLKKYIREFKPSIQHFYEFKELLGKNIFDDYVKQGFVKLAIHQISYSGLGTKSGGPLGGREQQSNYKIDCRWSPNYICKKIDKIHHMFQKMEYLQITSIDFEELICDTDKSVIYLDPPYYIKGNNLYEQGLSHADHVRLSECLKNCKNNWLLSYDDCPEIRQLYDNWAVIESTDVNYSITATKDKETGKRESRTKPELLITNYHE